MSTADLATRPPAGASPAAHAPRRSRLRVAGFVAAFFVVLCTVRVLTGADELTSSGTLSIALVATMRSRWPVSAACGPSARAWSTSASRA